MAHWLFKSEPSAWSFAKQAAPGAKGTDWNGVRNHPAKLNMMAMKVGDQGFFYHSNEGKAIVGIVEVIKPYYPIRATRPASSAWSISAPSAPCPMRSRSKRSRPTSDWPRWRW